MRILSLYIALSSLCMTACNSLSVGVEKSVDTMQGKAGSLVKDVGGLASADMTGRSNALVEYSDGIWLGKKIVKLEQPTLPSIFYETATFDRNVSTLTDVAERITLFSKIPVSVSPEALVVSYSGSLSGPVNSGTVAKTPAIGAQVNAGLQGMSRSKPAIRISYINGDFKGLLDVVAARFGVFWKYVNGTIQFYYTDSRTYQIHAIPGDSTFTASVASGAKSTAGGGSSAGGEAAGASGLTTTNSQNTGVKSQLSVYSNIEKSVLAMLSMHGRVVSSSSTGTMTVVDTPDVLDRVATYIEEQNKLLSRQVTINVTVLRVLLDQGDNYGIQWNLVYENLQSHFGIVNQLATVENATSFSAGILKSSGKWSGTKAIVQALSTQGKVSQETSASVVTLNNQPVPVQVATETTYLKSSQTTLTQLVGATTTLDPGMVTTGFNMSLLPHVLGNGVIQLQFSTDISALTSLASYSSNNSSIQTPVVDTRNFLQRVQMKSNETLIISGFEQTEDALKRNGTGDPKNMLLGGSSSATKGKEVIVILITPVVMGLI